MYRCGVNFKDREKNYGTLRKRSLCTWFLSFSSLTFNPYASPHSVVCVHATVLHTSLSLSLSESLCHGWPVSSLCRASPGSAQLARCGSAGQRQEAAPALLVQKGAHQADRPSVSSSSMLSPRLPQSQHTHMPTYILYVSPQTECRHTSISGPMPNRFGPIGT